MDRHSVNPSLSDIPTTLVHMAPDELNALDDAQGGPSIDPTYGIREYRKLAVPFENEEVRNIFRQVMADYADDGKLSPELEMIYQRARQIQGEPHPYIKAPAERESPIREIEKNAPAPDKEMALLPRNMVEFFLQMEGRNVATDPETGLLRFGKFGRNFIRSVVRVGSTIAGATLGGPLGAALGNVAGRAVTGQKVGSDMLTAGLKNAAYTLAGQAALTGLGAGTAGGIMGSGVGTTGSTLGSLATQGIGPANWGSFGHLWGGLTGAAAPGIGHAAVAGTHPATAATAATAIPGAGHAAVANTAAAAAPSGGILGMLSSPAALIPLAAMGMSYMGQRKAHEDQKEQQKEIKEAHEKEKERMGWNTPMRSAPPIKRRWNPKAKEDRNEPWLINDEPNPWGYGAASGGLIKGPGDGTADKIKTQVPSGSFILSADVVSKFGNGSSHRGAEVLDHFFDKLPSHPHSSLMATGGRRQQSANVPVYLSNDEYCVSPDKVTALGNGSNEHGSHMLHQMMKNIRLQKDKSGGKLPPDSHSPMYYMGGVSSRKKRGK